MENAAPSIEDRISAVINEQEVPQEPAQEPVSETPTEPLEQGESPSDELAEQSEAVQEEPGEEIEQSDEDIPTVESLSDLAEHLGVEVADLYNLNIPVTTADGERAEVSLSEWKDGYQAKSKLQKAQQEADELRVNLQSQYEKAQQQADDYARQASAAIELANGQLLQEFNSIDWNTLQQQNPAEWAVKRQQFQERQGQIQAAYQQAQTVFQRAKEESQFRQQQEMQQLLAKEKELFVRALPDIKDETSRHAEMQKIAGYMENLGFQEHEIAGLVDHRTAVAFRKAMLFDEQQKKGSAARKKIQVGQKKVLKPGARQSKDVQAKERLQSQRTKLRKSGKVDDAAALIAQLNMN